MPLPAVPAAISSRTVFTGNDNRLALGQGHHIGMFVGASHGGIAGLMPHYGCDTGIPGRIRRSEIQLPFSQLCQPVIIINISHSARTPIHHPVSSLVWSAPGHEMSDVFVNSVCLMRGEHAAQSAGDNGAITARSAFAGGAFRQQ